ncbi:hypothetical protein [uncultured Enterococcus sp.]|uniref:hypothetical protein n=1 Tax=uncultured Enterococcus sp. TaxID=167972 RepID=UPI002AA622A8|nr:hypothetical protein [uncultured Enterococcus sp.]
MMKLLKQLSCFLVILGSLALIFLVSSQLAQATVTNGNIRYFKEVRNTSESSISSGSSTTTESSTTDTNSTSTDSTTTESSTIDTSTESSTTESTATDSTGTVDSTSSEEVIIKPSGSSGSGNFLKTNDTVNYIFVVVGVIFVLIAVYNLKKT